MIQVVSTASGQPHSDIRVNIHIRHSFFSFDQTSPYCSEALIPSNVETYQFDDGKKNPMKGYLRKGLEPGQRICFTWISDREFVLIPSDPSYFLTPANAHSKHLWYVAGTKRKDSGNKFVWRAIQSWKSGKKHIVKLDTKPFPDCATLNEPISTDYSILAGIPCEGKLHIKNSPPVSTNTTIVRATIGMTNTSRFGKTP